MGMKYLLKVSNSIFDENFSDVLPDPFFLPLPRAPLSSHPFASQCRSEVPDGGRWGIKRKGEMGGEGRGKERDETKSCVPRVREKEIAIFFSRNGWENLRGAWRPSTRIWRVALVHRAGGTSNHRNLHHLLHSPSPSPPCSRARHPPPNRDSCRRRPVSRYRSSRRRYPRNPHRSPAPRRPRTTQSEMPHVSAPLAAPYTASLQYTHATIAGRCESGWSGNSVESR